MDLVQFVEDSVTDEDVQPFADKHKMPFFKASALKGIGVEEAIQFLIKEVFEAKIPKRKTLVLEPEKPSKIDSNPKLVTKKGCCK